MNPDRILTIIPARGGSKAVPRKNIVDLCGKPLIAWSIGTGRSLLAVGAVARCIVSTDSEEIAAVAQKFGADVPFLRPASAATDNAKAEAYVRHALDILEGTDPPFDLVMILQPTNPIRDTEALIQALRSFAACGAQSMISCYEEDYICEQVLYEPTASGRVRPRHFEHAQGVRRQDHIPSLVRNGAVYVTRVPFFRATGRLVCDEPFLMRMKKIESINLNTIEDLELLRAVLCK